VVGSGVARLLLAHCLGGLAAAQIPRCNVFLYDDNVAGLEFWSHNGWEVATTWKTVQKRL
jgi:hypothetical protein